MAARKFGAKNKPGDPLSPRQQEVMDFIKGRLIECGVAPSIREIAEKLGLGGTNSVMVHIRPLIVKGALRHVGNAHARSYLPVVEPGHCPCCNQKLPE